MKPFLFLFDVDWTLCSLYDVRPKAYTSDEEPIFSNVLLLRSLYNTTGESSDVHIWILTARKKSVHYDHTLSFLKKNISPYVDIDERFHIYMEEDSLARTNHVFKKEKLKKLQEDYTVLWLIDDNENLVDVCKELNIPFYLFNENYQWPISL